MFGEQFDVHPGLVVVALGVRPGSKLDQVVITRLVLGKDGQVVALVIAAWPSLET